MYGMPTPAPSINFIVDGFGFLLVFALLKDLCWVALSCRTLWRRSISFARNPGVEHTCLALWMKVWIR